MNRAWQGTSLIQKERVAKNQVTVKKREAVPALSLTLYAYLPFLDGWVVKTSILEVRCGFARGRSGFDELEGKTSSKVVGLGFITLLRVHSAEGHGLLVHLNHALFPLNPQCCRRPTVDDPENQRRSHANR